MKVARLYLRVSTEEQDLTRQADIEQSTRAAGYYIAGVYREKASGARADRPERLRMIADLQPGEVVAGSDRPTQSSASRRGGATGQFHAELWARSSRCQVLSICQRLRPQPTVS